MKIKLSREALDGLPAPDRQGMIRANCTLEITGDGEVNLLEINDNPVPSSADEVESMEPPEIPADLAGGAPPQY